LNENVAATVYKTEIKGRKDLFRRQRDTPYQQNLADKADVSDKLNASIIRVKIIVELGTM
jgi:hypothetical protein